MVKIAESIEEQKNVSLNGEEVNSTEFNERLRSLRNDERIVETSEDNFTTVQRMNG